MKKNDNKAMFQAIEKGDKKTLIKIIDGNASALEEVGFHNRLVRDKTPLMYAMQCRNFELCHWLLDRGANASTVMPDGPRSSVIGQCTYFAYCDELNHDKWLALAIRLLDQGADVSSGLLQALWCGGRVVKRTEFLKLFLDRGANLDQRSPGGEETIRELFEINKSKLPEEWNALIDKYKNNKPGHGD